MSSDLFLEKFACEDDLKGSLPRGEVVTSHCVGDTNVQIGNKGSSSDTLHFEMWFPLTQPSLNFFLRPLYVIRN